MNSVTAGVGQPQDCVRVEIERHWGTTHVAQNSSVSVTVGQPVSPVAVGEAVRSIGSNEYRSDVSWAAIGTALENVRMGFISGMHSKVGSVRKKDC